MNIMTVCTLLFQMASPKRPALSTEGTDDIFMSEYTCIPIVCAHAHPKPTLLL